MTMYPCTKFQLVWRTSDIGTKFATTTTPNHPQKMWIQAFEYFARVR